MKTVLISLLANLLGQIKPELLKSIADKVLDMIEDSVEASKNKIDDAVVLPLCNTIRIAFKIEDND